MALLFDLTEPFACNRGSCVFEVSGIERVSAGTSEIMKLIIARKLGL